MQPMSGYFIKAVGENRNKPRIWLQGAEVSSAGLSAGSRYDIHVKGGTIVLRANPDGSRVVSKKIKGEVDLPIIDLNSKELLALFDGMAAVRLVQRQGEIYILPLASEIKKKERLTRLRDKMERGIPLDIGSAAFGGGVLSHAIHAGLKAGGVESKLRFANEIRGELIDHAMANNDSWSKDTIPLVAPMQELAFDESAMRHVPRVEVFEAGIPCSGASVAGRAKRGTAVPEDHPHVGHLVVSALMIMARANPAIILIENVVPYSSSASAAILRNQLKDLGYNTHETVLDGADFNALEHRKRWFMAAVTDGMHFDWDMLQFPEKKDMILGDLLEDLPDDHPSWSTMPGLVAKEKRDLEAGKGFRMQVYGADADKIGTLTKGMAKNRSTDPKIAHPNIPGLMRVPTAKEHARVKQIPEHLVAGLAQTIAHEVLGQSVVYDVVKEVGTSLAKCIQDFCTSTERAPKDIRELAEIISAEINDSASMVVSEIRRPLAGVRYEGAITVNDMGAVIQDIGNGVGILHKGGALGQVRLGEVLKVVYPSARAEPSVEHLSDPAPVRTAALDAVVAQVDLFSQEVNLVSPEQASSFAEVSADEEVKRSPRGPRGFG